MSLRCSTYFLVRGSFRLPSCPPAHTIAGGVGLPIRRTIKTFAGSICHSRCRVTLTGKITRRREALSTEGTPPIYLVHSGPQSYCDDSNLQIGAQACVDVNVDVKFSSGIANADSLLRKQRPFFEQESCR